MNELVNKELDDVELALCARIKKQANNNQQSDLETTELTIALAELIKARACGEIITQLMQQINPTIERRETECIFKKQ